MRRLLLLLILGLLLWSPATWANGVDPEEPVEFLPYPNTALIDPEVSVQVTYLAGTDTFSYEHTLYLKPSSLLPLFSLEIVTDAEILEQSGPSEDFYQHPNFDFEGMYGPPTIAYGPKSVEVMPRPGDTMSDCVSVSTGFPSVAATYTEGDVVPPSGQQVILPPTAAQGAQTWESGKVKIMSVGPFKKPAQQTPTEYADFIIGEVNKSQPLGWHDISLGLSNSVSMIRSKVAAGQDQQAAQAIVSLLGALEVERGHRITDNGYYLIKPNLERLLSLMGGPPVPPSTQILPVIKDALVYEKSQHSNEGANPRLTLEKITGKAARNLLGFDLSNINSSTLTKATLVLTIDPGGQATGWGNGETVTVKPLMVAWTEGNGRKYGLPGNQQSTGSGSGATWSSPLDTNIANDSSNSTVNWSGGATYTAQGSTPALVVNNHQTGELQFDVTQDVKNGALHGWLLRKDAENKGSKVSFYSKEGALAAGNTNMAPRLLLEYTGTTALNGPQQIYSALASFLGFSRRPVTLQAAAGVNESPWGLKELLSDSPRSAFVGEHVVLGLAGHYPPFQLGARLAYRSWLWETLAV